MENYTTKPDRIFKGIDKVDKTWICGFYIRINNTAMIYSPVFCENYIVYADTVCQQTGACDHFGNYIYEGDILMVSKRKYCRVAYSGCKYVLVYTDGIVEDLIPKTVFELSEIKGNIHDNIIYKSALTKLFEGK